MPSIRTLSTLCLLSLLVLILPQCSDKSSGDYYKEGLSKLNDQDFDGAEEAFQKAIEKNPKNPNGHYGLGGIHNYREQYDLAEQAFKTTLRLDPTFVDAHFSLGYTYEQTGQKEKSEKQYATYRRLKKKTDQVLEEEKKSR